MQRLDHGRTAAVGVNAIGVRANHQQTGHAVLVKRQQVFVILQQHDGFAGDLQCLRGMVDGGVASRLAGRTGVAQHVQRIHDGDHAFDFHIDVAFLDLAVLDGFLQRIREIVIIEVRRHRHLNVHADLGTGLGVTHRAPIGDDEAVETVFTAQNVVKQLPVFTAFDAVDEIVGAHDGEHAAILHRRLESRQVDLAQCPLAYGLVNVKPVGLLAVDRIVLRASGHVGFLHTLNVGHALRGGQYRILAHVLEIATAQRATLDIDGRSENHVLAAAARFLAKYLAGRAGQIGIPCGSDGGTGRQVGHIVTGVVQRRPVVVMQLGPHAHRAVVHLE